MWDYPSGQIANKIWNFNTCWKNCIILIRYLKQYNPLAQRLSKILAFHLLFVTVRVLWGHLAIGYQSILFIKVSFEVLVLRVRPIFSTPRREPLKQTSYTKIEKFRQKKALKKYDPVVQTAGWLHWSFDIVGLRLSELLNFAG